MEEYRIPTAIVIKNIPFQIPKETLLGVMVRLRRAGGKGDADAAWTSRRTFDSPLRSRSTTTLTTDSSVVSPLPTLGSQQTQRSPSRR